MSDNRVFIPLHWRPNGRVRATCDRLFAWVAVYAMESRGGQYCSHGTCPLPAVLWVVRREGERPEALAHVFRACKAHENELDRLADHIGACPAFEELPADLAAELAETDARTRIGRKL